MSEQAEEGASLDEDGQAEIEGRTGAKAAKGSADAPPAGPHAKPALTSPDATPGAGSLPSPSTDDEAAAGTG